MADAKVTALAALTTPATADLVYVVDDVAGTPIGKKVTLGDVYKGLGTGTPDNTKYLRGDGAWAVPGAGIYQPLDDDLSIVGDLGDPLQILRTDAAGTAVEWVTIAVGGDVVGPASSIDNAIPRFDSTTGKLLQGGAQSATISDAGSLTINPTSGTTAIVNNWTAGQQAVLVSVTDPNTGHGPWKLLHESIDFGQAGANDFVMQMGVLGDGTTTELNADTIETGFDQGSGWRSNERYSTVQHTNATYWPDSRRMGYTWYTYDNPATNPVSPQVSYGLVNLDSVGFSTDYPNPDNPGIGAFGVYANWQPNLVTGAVIQRLFASTDTNYLQSQVTNSLATIVSEGVPLTIQSSVAGGLSLSGVGAGTLSFATTHVMSYNGNFAHLNLIRTRNSTSATTFDSGDGLCGGIDLMRDAPGQCGIWSAAGGDIFFATYVPDGPDLLITYPGRVQMPANRIFGWVPASTLFATDIDAGFMRHAAGIVKVVTSSSGGLGGLRAAKLTALVTTEDASLVSFNATADGDTTSAISTLTTSGATTHHVQVDINGTKAWIAVSTNAPS